MFRLVSICCRTLPPPALWHCQASASALRACVIAYCADWLRATWTARILSLEVVPFKGGVGHRICLGEWIC